MFVSVNFVGKYYHIYSLIYLILILFNINILQLHLNTFYLLTDITPYTAETIRWIRIE